MQTINKINDLYLGAAYDAMRKLGYKYNEFFIDIKPKAGYNYTTNQYNCISGPAFTTKGQIVEDILNDKITYEYFDRIRLDIYKQDLSNKFVLLEANDDCVAHSGDITSLIYKKLGAIGFITDGNVRDIDIINNQHTFPTFCIGANPIDAINYWAIIDYNKPIILQNVLIKPNDYIIASKDGIIRVPKEEDQTFIAEALTILKKEDVIRDKIQYSDKNNIFELLNKLFNEEGRW